MKLGILIVLLGVLLGCNSVDKKEDANQSPTAEVRYATCFKLVQRADYTELQILNAGKVEKKYALLKKNQSPVLATDVVPLQIPLKSIVVLSGTHVGMLSKLNLQDRIVGVSNRNYIYNSAVKKRIESNQVFEFDNFSTLNPERVLKTKSKVVFQTGFDGNTVVLQDKLAKLGIQCIPNYDWSENHPLGKAEWIKVFGYLFGKEKEANAYFNQVEKEYLELVQVAKSQKEKPTVFSGMIFGDVWYMPAGQSFGAVFFRDAGADYCEKNEQGTGSASYTFEQVFTKNQTAQIWMNVEVETKKQLLQANPKYSYFNAFQTGNMFSYAHQMNQFWENSAIEPHHVLSDMIQIFHAGKVKPAKMYFYRKLPE